MIKERTKSKITFLIIDAIIFDHHWMQKTDLYVESLIILFQNNPSTLSLKLLRVLVNNRDLEKFLFSK
jgi:hypothetical protein